MENCALTFFVLVSMILFSVTAMPTVEIMIGGIIPATITKLSILNLRLPKKSLLRFKIIAHSPFCIYIFRILRIVLDLLTQSSDVYINGTDITRILIAPYKA